MSQKRGSPLLRTILVLACLVIVVGGIKAAVSIVVPFLCALFLMVLTLPALRWLRLRGVPSGLSLVLVLCGTVISGALVIGMMGSSLAGFRGDLDRYTQRLGTVYGELKDKLGEFVDISEEVDRAIDPGVALGYVGDAVAQLGSLMSNAVVILLMLAFLLAESSSFGRKLMIASSNPDAMKAYLEKVGEGVTSYFSIKTGVSLLTGIAAGILLWLCGVDHPLLWAFVAFLLNFVPNIGSALAAVPPLLLVIVQPELGAGTFLVVLIGYLVINTVFGSILEPRMMGKGLDLSTLIVFLSLLFWGWVLGPIGMLLSVPLTAAVKIALEAFPEGQPLAQILGSGSED